MNRCSGLLPSEGNPDVGRVGGLSKGAFRRSDPTGFETKRLDQTGIAFDRAPVVMSRIGGRGRVALEQNRFMVDLQLTMPPLECFAYPERDLTRIRRQSP
jgi:hypothetical protein